MISIRSVEIANNFIFELHEKGTPGVGTGIGKDDKVRVWTLQASSKYMMDEWISCLQANFTSNK